MLQLPRGASCEQQATELPENEQGHKESMIVLSHAVAHHLHSNKWIDNIHHTAAEQATGVASLTNSQSPLNPMPGV